jgi:phosphatidylglycerol lysyltransferase
MEFLIATAALTFREEGARFGSLSGAPLARLDRGEQSRASQRLLDMIANTTEPVYGFQSLLHLKANSSRSTRLTPIRPRSARSPP